VLSVSAEHVLEVVGPDKPGDIVSERDALLGAEEIGRELVESSRRDG
jgi:hypothetical protein